MAGIRYFSYSSEKAGEGLTIIFSDGEVVPVTDTHPHFSTIKTQVLTADLKNDLDNTDEDSIRKLLTEKDSSADEDYNFIVALQKTVRLKHNNDFIAALQEALNLRLDKIMAGETEEEDLTEVEFFGSEEDSSGKTKFVSGEELAAMTVVVDNLVTIEEDAETKSLSDVDLKPYISSKLAAGEEVLISFDYAALDGVERNVHEARVEELKDTSEGNIVLIVERADGAIRSYRSDLISNLTIDNYTVAVDEIQDEEIYGTLSIKEFNDKSNEGYSGYASFDFIKVNKNVGHVDNVRIVDLKVSEKGNNILIGERSDGKIRHYRADRISNFTYRWV